MRYLGGSKKKCFGLVHDFFPQILIVAPHFFIITHPGLDAPVDFNVFC